MEKLMEKKLKDKQKAVKDARKLKKTMDAMMEKAGPPGNPFHKFFSSMAELLEEVADQTEMEVSIEIPAAELPFSDVDDEKIDEDDDEMMEEEEDV